jgi:amino acid adenylation domain-containing protein
MTCARSLHVPLRTVLLGVHVATIGLVSGETDVVTGCVAHGRPETEGGGDVVGLFVNTLPIRVRTDVPTWPELLGRVHDAESSALAHRTFPLFEIQRLAGRGPLFETIFDYRDFHVYDRLPDGDRLRVVRRDHDEHVDIPLGVVFSRTTSGQLELTVTYHRRQFGDDEMRDLLDRYLLMLGYADGGGDPRSAGRLLLPHETRSLADWNDTAVELGEPPLLHDFFFASAARRPDATAVVDDRGDHRYGTIARRATALAARLVALGVGPESVVGVHAARGADFVVALLGVLRAGAAALPLDPEHPSGRLLQATADADVRVLVTGPGTSVSFPFRGNTVPLDDAESDRAPADPRVAGGNLAYVLYTSGSTGRPKGVMLEHRALVNVVAWMARRLGVRQADRFAQRTPVGWDGALIELFAAFAAGATVVTVPTDVVADPASFTEFAQGTDISVLLLVPSIFAVHLAAGVFGELPALRVVGSAGEVLSRQAVEEFAAQSQATLFNLYGPTEAGIGVSDTVVEPGGAGATVPIGRPAGNVAIHVLDDRGDPAPIGLAGELCVATRQLARGYLGSPAATAERFVPDHLSGVPGTRVYRTGDRARWLPGGMLEFLGRNDGQVKIRGVRVELGEVEAALAGHPAVLQAAVLARPGRDGRLALVAYVVPADATADVREIREDLRDRLVRAAVPTIIIPLAELPVLANGKVDRSALPMPTVDTKVEWLAPRDPVEARLCTLWAEVLGVDAVGIRDDFFDLGGHSLIALRLTMRLRNEMGREIPVETVLSASTVERLAVVLRETSGPLPTAKVVPLREDGDGMPIFIMHGLGGQIFRYHLLARRMGDERPAYAVPATGFTAGETPHRSLDSMAEDYADRIQAVRPHGPYLLCGHCIGGNIAVEVARRLRARGEEVPLVVMFWTHANEPVIKSNVDDEVALLTMALARGEELVSRELLAGLGAEERLLTVVNAAAEAGTLIAGAEDVDQARRNVEVFKANARAVVDYRHAPYDGDVLLLIPDADDAFAPGDVFGWDDVVTGRLEVASIPGDRGTCLDEPLVRGTAEVLVDRIEGLGLGGR